MIKNSTLGLSLQDMLLLVGIKRSTGELVVESGNNIGTMLMHGGRILQAFSPYSRAIGDLLVEDGLLSDSELIETLKIQKKNAYSPLGGLLLKMGRVPFEVIEMMVHEQIRTAVKEFQSWNNVNFNFVEKNILPFDSIHLTVHEFISPDTLQSAKAFFSLETTAGQSSPAESSTMA